jgi:hypothetical protein
LNTAHFRTLTQGTHLLEISWSTHSAAASFLRTNRPQLVVTLQAHLYLPLPTASSHPFDFKMRHLPFTLSFYPGLFPTMFSTRSCLCLLLPSCLLLAYVTL